MKDYKKETKILTAKLTAYKKAYEKVSCYFDSIDEEEQEKLDKILIRIFKNMNKKIESYET